MIPRPPATPTAADRATGGAGWVRLADQTVAIDRIRAHPDRFTGLFTRARTEIGHAVCQCRPDHPTRLVIRCRRGRYHLATWPGSGDQHDPSCPWYRPHATLSGRSMHSTAIDTTDTGTSIRLATPLILRGTTRTTRPSTPTPSPTGSTTSTSRGSLGLLALLHYLWEQATLNLWRPGQGQGTWHCCWRRVDEHAREVRVNGLALADTLWIVPPFRPGTAEQTNAAWDRFLTRLITVGRYRRRGLVLGEIRASEPTDYGVRLRLAHHRASLFMTHQLLDRVQRSYPAVFSNDTHPSRRQVVLCLVERSPRGYPIITDLAAMLTTATYLPVDSSHERRMADALADAGRTFLKPLRYDHHTAVFPDFVLLDTDPEPTSRSGESTAAKTTKPASAPNSRTTADKAGCWWNGMSTTRCPMSRLTSGTAHHSSCQPTGRPPPGRVRRWRADEGLRR